MKTLTVHFDLFEKLEFNNISELLSTSHNAPVFQWDFDEEFKKNAIKEIRQAIRLFKKRGTIDC